MAEQAAKNSILSKTRKQIDQDLEPTTLTTIFPQEIWMQIFRHTTSDVLCNAAHSSKYFEDLLYPHRSQWIFPLILQFIVANLRNGYQYSHVLEILFTLRRVCKPWSKAVDSFFENMDARQLLERGKAWRTHWKPTRPTERDLVLRMSNGRKCIITEKKLNLFFKHFEKTHPSTGVRSPLISKNVVIANHRDNISDPESSWPACIKFFSTYGHSVKVCSIILHFYDQLCHLLKLMPNLQALWISYSGNDFEEEYDSGELPKWSAETLPKLRKLNILQLECVQGSIANDLISKCNNLSSFRSFESVRDLRVLSNLYSFRSSESVLDITGLAKHPLKQLCVCIDLQSYAVLKSQSYSWPLTDLELEFDKNCFVEWPELFALINQNWNKTLKRFSITLPGTKESRYVEQIAKWSLTPLLKLPCLTHLTLTMINLHSLDFILPLRDNLEYLCLTFEYPMEETQNMFSDVIMDLKKKQVIKLMGHLKPGIMTGSNIWTLFPKLKKVRDYHRKVRHGYEYCRPGLKNIGNDSGGLGIGIVEEQ